MGKLNKIVIPLTTTIATEYNTLETAHLFDGTSLSLKILPSNYTANNPIQRKVIQTLNNPGFSHPVVEKTQEFYKITFTCQDSSPIIREILEELILTSEGGNLTEFSIANPDSFTSNTLESLVGILDYHRLDNSIDRSIGYTIRIGIITEIEDLKGTFRNNTETENYTTGTKISFTQTHKISPTTNELIWAI